jgi:hypothetical protein
MCNFWMDRHRYRVLPVRISNAKLFALPSWHWSHSVLISVYLSIYLHTVYLPTYLYTYIPLYYSYTHLTILQCLRSYTHTGTQRMYQGKNMAQNRYLHLHPSRS